MWSAGLRTDADDARKVGGPQAATVNRLAEFLLPKPYKDTVYDFLGLAAKLL